MKKRRRLFVSVALSLLLRPEPVLANADGFCFHSSYERQLRMASQTRRHKKFQELKILMILISHQCHLSFEKKSKKRKAKQRKKERTPRRKKFQELKFTHRVPAHPIVGKHDVPLLPAEKSLEGRATQPRCGKRLFERR
jgi:hypothetical protein